jgi:Putative Ig domain
MRKLLPLLVVFAAASSVLAAKPKILSPTTDCGRIGVPYSYQITADQTITTWGAAPLPAGLTVNTSTGLISGTPTTAGTYSITLSATNSSNQTGTGLLTLTISSTPTISSINPSCTTAGDPQFTLTVNGTNFVSTSTVNWNGTPRATTFVSSTRLTATVPAALIATPGTASVTVVSCGATSGAVTFTIVARTTISSLNPTCATAGGPDFTLTVTGTNFVSTSTVNWNSTALATTFVSSTQLTATVPASLIATAGTASITIGNLCGGASSTATPFTIANTPVITSPLTACGTVGVAFSYTITATNNPTSFSASPIPAGLSFNTSTGVISGTPTSAGTTNVTITASNGASPCNTSAPQTLVITVSARPMITSIDPTCVTPGGPQFTLTVIGTNFVSTSIVNWNGAPLATTFVSSTQLTATVPAILIANAGTASITVVNSTCAGATSTPVTLTIANSPVITSPLTATGQIGVAFSYTITATNTNNGTTYCASPLPPGLSLGNGGNRNVISGTPTAVGTTNVTIKVFNGAGTCSNPPTCYAQATLVITICPQDPTITSALTATAIVGTPFTYQITADNSPISFDATDLPGGLTVCHDSSEGCTPGLISGTPTATGVFPVIISATSSNAGPCGSSTATDTLVLTVNLPSGVFILPFPGQLNVFYTGSPPPPGGTIPFPRASTDNYFVLYWNAPGSNTNQAIADSANGGLQRNADLVGMQFNHYDPTIPGSRPDPTKNVWRGNPMPPNDNTAGQFGDPRASWYITDPWPTADYVTSSYWAGPNPAMVPLNWPDSGHPFSYTGLQPADKGQYPTDIMGGPTPPPTPTPDPKKAISLLSTSSAGSLASLTELGNVWDPAQLSYAVVNPGGALPDIPNTATRSPRGAGGHTLAIGRPEFSMFDQNRTRAWQLLDVFSAKTSSTNFTNTVGLVNINTASRDVLRSLAAGILQNRDVAIQPPLLQGNLYPPTGNAAQPTNVQQANKFADAVINSRPLLSTAALSAIRDSQGQPFFGNPNQYINSTQTPPTEWNDPGREELFAKIYNLATTRSRNFRVFVTGQSLDKNGNVLSTVTKVYHVFIKPNRDSTTGAIQSQQVQIKYEGSM